MAKTRKSDKHSGDNFFTSDPCDKCGSTFRFKGSNQCNSSACRKQNTKYATLTYRGNKK